MASPLSAQIDTLNLKLDTVTVKPERSFLKKSIVPAGLILSGILMSDSKFERNLNRETVAWAGDRFSSSIDDYTRFVPIAQMYIADIAGIKAKNHWFDQTKNAALSIIITDIITNALKKSVYKVRPNRANAKAFPSGHTSLGFTSAAVLYEEFRETSPLLAYSGYGFAAVTGSMRLLNNRHFLSDVLVGAGLGIVVTKLVYHFDYLIRWNPFKATKEVTFVPRYNNGNVGLYFSKKF